MSALRKFLSHCVSLIVTYVKPYWCTDIAKSMDNQGVGQMIKKSHMSDQNVALVLLGCEFADNCVY